MSASSAVLLVLHAQYKTKTHFLPYADKMMTTKLIGIHVHDGDDDDLTLLLLHGQGERSQPTFSTLARVYILFHCLTRAENFTFHPFFVLRQENCGNVICSAFNTCDRSFAGRITILYFFYFLVICTFILHPSGRDSFYFIAIALQPQASAPGFTRIAATTTALRKQTSCLVNSLHFILLSSPLKL